MANIRREFGDDLSFKNGNLGINTTTTQERVDVVGVVKGRDLNVTGVTSLTAYEGFLRADNQIVEETNLEFGNGLKASLSGEIIVGTGVTVTIGAVGLGTTSVGVGTHTIQSNIDTTDINLAGGSEIECLKVYNTFTPPSGGTNERPYAPKPGELYYNYDFKTIEFFDGYGWRQVDNTTRSGRAVFAGGYTPTSGAAGDFASVIDYVNISTRGNAVNFGEMHAGTYAALFGFSSSTRGVFGGGYKNATTAPNITNDVAYITIASEGNTIDFGNLNSAQNWGKSAHASSTRGLAMGGYSSVTDIDYVEIATLGNFLDFGDLIATEFGGAGMGSPTIALSVGSGPNGYVNQVTIASKGNAIKWGETDANPEYYAGGGSNSVRGLFNKTRSKTTQVQSLIIASSGTIENFGNLTSTNGSSSNYQGGNGNCASQTTLLFAGSANNANAINTIETISITTAGNATDFGDLTTKRGYMGACSDSHGGLGGF